jgi:hypothetical protein
MMSEYEHELISKIQSKCWKLVIMDEEGPEKETLKEEILKMWEEFQKINPGRSKFFGQEVHNALYPDEYIE